MRDAFWVERSGAEKSILINLIEIYLIEIYFFSHKSKNPWKFKGFSNIREVDLNYLLATEIIATATAVKN